MGSPSVTKVPRPKKILVRLPNWVGDAVMASPALRALRLAHPDAEISVMGRKLLGEIVETLPHVDRYLPEPPRGFSETRALAKSMARESFDWAVLLAESERAAIAPFLARIPVRAGYGHGALRRSMLTHAMKRPRTLGGRPLAFSMIERYLRITRMLGVPDAGSEMDLVITHESRQSVDRRLEKLQFRPDDKIVTVIAGAAFGSAKMWPPDRFAAACDELHERRGWRTILSLGPGEEEIARELHRHAKIAPTIMSDPLMSLGELAALLERSQMVLSNDTGPRSMAVALGIPVVAVLGPTEDGHTRHHLGRQRVLIEDVECRPCNERICPIDHRCMTRISPSRMVAAAEQLADTVGVGLAGREGREPPGPAG